MIRWMVAASAAMAVSGCATNDTGDTTGMTAASSSSREARAVLRMADGTEVGHATAAESGGAIRVSVDASKLPPGLHGAHVHTTGRCDGPDFATAGPHWNPTGRQHGTQNPAGPHGGDLPNMTIDAGGRGTMSMMLPSGTMTGLTEGDGSAFVIHAAADDLKTDPSGNSGGRIACGVFEAR